MVFLIVIKGAKVQDCVLTNFEAEDYDFWVKFSNKTLISKLRILLHVLLRLNRKKQVLEALKKTILTRSVKLENQTFLN